MKIVRILIIIFILSISILPDAFTVEVKRTGQIMSYKGKVEIITSKGRKIKAKKGRVLNEGDIIKTKGRAWVELELDGVESVSVMMESNSSVKIDELVLGQEKGMQKTKLDLLIGKMTARVQDIKHNKSIFEVRTPTSIVSTRGGVVDVTVEKIQ
jgi:hypothetical protein